MGVPYSEFCCLKRQVQLLTAALQASNPSLFAVKAGSLNQFTVQTTAAEFYALFAGGEKTGTGSLVFNSTPTLQNPKIQGALISSVDASTQWTYGTIAGGAQVNNFATSSAPAGQAIWIRSAGADTNIGINIKPKGTGELQYNGVEVGYRGLPITSHSADYTFVLADRGTLHTHASADVTGRTFTIPANATVAFPVGTCITINNENGAGAISIAIISDTLRLTDGSTGTRTLAPNGIATAIKMTATEWKITGTNLT